MHCSQYYAMIAQLFTPAKVSNGRWSGGLGTRDYWLHVNISYTHCTLLEAQSLHDTSTVPELHKIPQLQLRKKKKNNNKRQKSD